MEYHFIDDGNAVDTITLALMILDNNVCAC
jgi:hypothetical protein